MGGGDIILDPFWRTNIKTTRARLAFILEKENAYHDVSFIVGKESQIIKAHKLILIIASRVFEEMIENDSSILSTNNEKIISIQLRDVQPDAFRCLLKFIYTDKLDLNLEDAMSVLYSAKKFEIPELSDRCTELLKSNITEQNVLTIFPSAKINSEDELRDWALKFILRKSDSLISSPEFLKLGCEDFCTIIECDEFSVDEMKIFKTALRWAKEECKRFDMDDTAENHRYVLKKAIYLIRFPLLTVQQFSTEVVPTGILSSNEMLELYQYYTTPSNVKAQNYNRSHQSMMLFNPRERHPSKQHSFARKAQAVSDSVVHEQLFAMNISGQAANFNPMYAQPQYDSQGGAGFLENNSKQYSPKTSPYNSMREGLITPLLPAKCSSFKEGAVYKITNYDGTVLEMYLDTVVTRKESNSDCHFWTFTSKGADTAGYFLSSTSLQYRHHFVRKKPNTTDVHNRKTVQPIKNTGEEYLAQLWYTRSVGNGLFYIINCHDHSTLESSGNGMRVASGPEKSDAIAQLWNLEVIEK